MEPHRSGALPSRVAVIGLDGVPFTLLQSLFENGVMPSLGEVARSGSFLQMETALPPVSSTAWASFMTGENPGCHAIFGFTDLNDGEISVRLPSFDDIRAPTIWAKLPHKTALVVNLPFTYPARPLRGALISGFVAPVLERAVYPERLLPWLKAKRYRIDVDAVKARTDRHGLLDELFETIRVQEEVLLSLMQDMPWDLLVAVVTGTDRLNHFFFDAAYDANHPFHKQFVDYYRRVDAFFARLWDRVGGDTRLIVLSDHGFTRLKTQVYVNEILRMMGYLSFVRPNPQSLEEIDIGSAAFAMDPGRVYLNSRDRFKNGLLYPGERDSVLEALKAEFEKIRCSDFGIDKSAGGDTGNGLLFQCVLRREEVYEGAFLRSAPDLIVVPSAGIDLKATIGADQVAMKDIFTGTHTHDDAFLIVNDTSIRNRLPEPKITDVAALIIEALT